MLRVFTSDEGKRHEEKKKQPGAGAGSLRRHYPQGSAAETGGLFRILLYFISEVDGKKNCSLVFINPFFGQVRGKGMKKTSNQGEEPGPSTCADTTLRAQQLRLVSYFVSYFRGRLKKNYDREIFGWQYSDSALSKLNN